MKAGFDNQKYLETQSQHIRDRIAKFGGKLYLEFGGKLFDDYHASRVLPGFKPDSKLQMLMQLKDEAEIVIVINADDIAIILNADIYSATFCVDEGNNLFAEIAYHLGFRFNIFAFRKGYKAPPYYLSIIDNHSCHSFQHIFTNEN